MKNALFVILASAAASLIAADLDFWGPSSSQATNVVTSVTGSASLTVDARWNEECFSNEISFSSARRGFLLLVR